MLRVLFLVCFISTMPLFSKVWQSETIVTFSKSPLIKDSPISDEIKSLDVFNNKVFAVSKSNGIYTSEQKTLEFSHIITYNIDSNKTYKLYDSLQKVEDWWIPNLMGFQFTNLGFYKGGYDSLWTIHYIQDSMNVYFSKFDNKSYFENATKRKITHKFNLISFIDWQDSNKGVILGDGLYYTDNSGYTWQTILESMNEKITEVNFADCKIYNNNIYILCNHRLEEKVVLLKYDIETNTFSEHYLQTDKSYNRIAIEDGEIYLLGGKSRDDIFQKTYFLINKFNPENDSFVELYNNTGYNSKSSLTHLFKRNDTLRAYSKDNLIYVQSTDNGSSWEVKDDIYQLLISEYEVVDYNTDLIVIGFDTIYVVFDSSVIRISETIESSVSDTEIDYFVIYPNPAEDYIEISINKPSEGLEPSEGSEIAIYDVLGDKVLTESIHPMTRSHRMNVENLPRGVYFIKIGNKVEQFIKE